MHLNHCFLSWTVLASCCEMVIVVSELTSSSLRQGLQWTHSLCPNNSHGLSRRYDGSHHHECDLLWARSPIRERHIRWEIWHSKLLEDGGQDLRRSRLASNSWMRRTSNSSTADLHVKRQPALSIASVSSSEGVMPHWVIVVFRQSLYLYCPPGCRKPWWSCP